MSGTRTAGTCNGPNYPFLTRTARLPSLCIKGHTTDDAVLCTAEKTYNLRSVVLSNSVLVVTPSSSNADAGLDIRDEIHDVLELTLCVPKLHRLKGLLRGLEYGENAEDEDLYGEDDGGQVVRGTTAI